MKIEFNINEINSVEKIISDVLEDNDFNKMNKLIKKHKTTVSKKFLFPNSVVDKDSEFVSVQRTSLKPYRIISENEFYKIMEANKNGLSKRSGRYQEKLYSHYMYAVKLNDEGYISDVLNKAVKFQSDLDYVKSLMENKSFMKEWRKDFGSKSAIKIFKHKGNLRLINIIKERI